MNRPGKPPGLPSLTLERSALLTPKQAALVSHWPVASQTVHDDRFCEILCQHRTCLSQGSILSVTPGYRLCIHSQFHAPRKRSRYLTPPCPKTDAVRSIRAQRKCSRITSQPCHEKYRAQDQPYDPGLWVNNRWPPNTLNRCLQFRGCVPFHN